ncbi:MAG TPA: metallophosphoesterase [Acidobacteriota bacterium]|jgi:hypothetical protein
MPVIARRMSRILFFASLGLAVLLVVVTVVAYREAKHLETASIEIVLPRLPREFEGFRILFLSDLHLFNDSAYTQKVRDHVARVNADIAAIAGDFMDMHATERETLDQLRILLPAFQRFQKIYAVKGNQDSTRLMLELEKLGIRVLRGERDILKRGNATLGIAGVSSPFSETALNRSLQQMHAGAKPLPDCQILLSHSPDVVLRESSRKADLILAGHTHGGQIRLPWIGPLLTRTRLGRRYASGSFTFGSTQLFITRGVGTTYVPLRLLCPPEIVMITLRSKI